MALYLAELRKATALYGGRKWSNRYFFSSANAGEALSQGIDLWAANERGFHREDVFCYEVYVNLQGDAPFTPGTIQAVPTGVQRGSLARLVAGNIAHGSLVIRADFPVLGSRPSRKFYRLPLGDGDYSENTLTNTALIDALNAGIAGVASRNFIVDVDGEAWTGSGVLRGITTRRFGRDADRDVPTGPPFG